MTPSILFFGPGQGEPGSRMRQAHAQDTQCIDTTFPCTANDVRFGEVSLVSASNNCLDAPFGELTGIFELDLIAGPDRYDIGMYIGENGVAPNDPGAVCYHDFLTPLATPPSHDPLNTAGTGPFRDIEDDQGPPPDVCGDIRDEQSGNNSQVDAIFHTQQEVTILCVDNVPLSGFVDIEGCTSWDNNQADTCESVADAVPGTGAKCRCETVQSAIEVPSRIDLTKTTVSHSGVAGGTHTVVFDLTVQNTGLQDLDTITLTDDLSNTFSGSTLSNISVVLQASDLSEGGTAPTINGGYDGDTDIDLINTDGRLNADTTDGTGDSLTYRISVDVNPCNGQPYTNTADTTGDPVFSGSQVSDTASSLVPHEPTAVHLNYLAAETVPSRNRFGFSLLALVFGAIALVSRRR